MAVAPFSSGSFRASSTASLMTTIRTDLERLQTQLGTGKKVETYGALGAERSISLAFRSMSVEADGYRQTIQQSQIRLNVMDRNVDRMRIIADETRTGQARWQGFEPDPSTGLTGQQKIADLDFDQVIDMLNEQIDGRYLFGGRTTDVKPVLDRKTMFDGDGTRAGLKQMINERRQAELGATQTGRLAVAGALNVATVEREASPNVYGFQITSITETLSNGTVAGPAGALQTATITATAPAKAGETITIGLQLPNGTQKSVTLTARTGPLNAEDKGFFEIGTDANDQGLRLRTALTAELQRQAKAELGAYAAVTAAKDFFQTRPLTSITRVPGPGFATATAFGTATAANTVQWYRGDAQDPAQARGTVITRVDDGLTVSTGAQANESGFAALLAGLSSFALTTFGANDREAYIALSDRVADELDNAKQIQGLQTDLSVASRSIGRIDDRLRQKQSFYQSVIGDVENINQEEVASKILSLQTKLQATYQTTATIARLSLTDYL
jgi:flagellin-like hook-associated protein FlgL